MADQDKSFFSSETNGSLKKVCRPINLSYRDGCMKLLEELNYCRENTWYLPWKCVEERHAYEKCEYEIFKERVKSLKELEKVER
ncbi:hypothetical protein PNEG_01287 [Pneumocystis murina B123]|uniref:NADH dehydrogenase [ubiquinone] 1 beta subcomplex subunit 7 n=1 Tax=Pneumocystis murina (strain B123) TaxID=1069680 RepID=M7NTH2_PNEMU|nr:hypothetical protein PNEG_01287 [Pneumocystis murina B123]EMR10582.1 hypothetical protein PNEG_01287 [Pneumocystis murina B123]